MRLTSLTANPSIPPNDWKVEQLTGLSAFLLLLVLILTALTSCGLQVPALTQAAGFLFITFIPGLLLLRILRVHNTGFVECLGYSVGLSLAFDMAILAAINFILPLAGILQPLRPLPISIAFALLTSILILWAHFRDHEFTHTVAQKQSIHWPPVLLLTLLLLSTILAARIADTQGNNTLLVICLAGVAFIVLTGAIGKFIRPPLYPFAVFIISLCLLYQTTLMTPYLVGSDIYTEYHYYNLASIAGIWDPGAAGIVNSCLSITILAPLYSILMNISGAWVFKAVYPLIFALMPVVMFQMFKQQVGPRFSFLATFFFLAVPTFSLEMISLCRQQVAELFFVLLVFLLVDRRLPVLPKLIMACTFAAGVIVSHYGIGTIGFIYMALLLPLVLIIRSNWFRGIWGWLAKNKMGLPASSLSLSPWAMAIIVIVFFAFGFFWYSFTASGINFTRLVEFFTKYGGAVSSAFTLGLPGSDSISRFLDLFSRDVLVRTALGLDFADATFQGRIFRVIQLLTQLLLVIGIFRLICKPSGLKFVPEYLAFCIINSMLLAGCILLPGFAAQFNATRMYHLSLVTLAPFFILGCIVIWESCVYLKSVLHRSTASKADALTIENGTALIALVIMLPYFIFCSGLVFELSGQSVTDRVDTPYSIALSKYRIDLTSAFTTADGVAAAWLAQKSGTDSAVFSDDHTIRFLEYMDVQARQNSLTVEDAHHLASSYIFLTTWNVARGEATIAISPGLRRYVSLREIALLTKSDNILNRVYNDGGAQVLAVEDLY